MSIWCLQNHLLDLAHLMASSSFSSPFLGTEYLHVHTLYYLPLIPLNLPILFFFSIATIAFSISYLCMSFAYYGFCRLGLLCTVINQIASYKIFACGPRDVITLHVHIHIFSVIRLFVQLSVRSVHRQLFVAVNITLMQSSRYKDRMQN